MRLLAEAAPTVSAGRLAALGCAALSCMLLVSALALIVVLVRRSRGASGPS